MNLVGMIENILRGMSQKGMSQTVLYKNKQSWGFKSYLSGVVIAWWVPLSRKGHSWVIFLLHSSYFPNHKKIFLLQIRKVGCLKTCGSRHTSHSASYFHLGFFFNFVSTISLVWQQNKLKDRFDRIVEISPWSFQSAWKIPRQSILNWGENILRNIHCESTMIMHPFCRSYFVHKIYSQGSV